MVAIRTVSLISLLTAFPAVAAEPIEGPIAAEVERVIDGDTVSVAARIWVGHTVTVSVRLAGVDAPEIFRPQCPAEKDAARRAKAFVEAMLSGDEVTLHDVIPDKYGGRVVARIETANGEDLGEALLDEGLAAEDGDVDPWC
jgi:endonuclease YncB( thermonuclease family)